jgi:plasmid stabilization system protein ParE
MTHLDFDRRAIRELRLARRRYAHVDQRLSDDFVTKLDEAIAWIASHPLMGSPHLHGTRYYRLKRFPYYLIYAIDNDLIRIIAVAHLKRNPGYWSRRLKP